MTEDNAGSKRGTAQAQSGAGKGPGEAGASTVTATLPPAGAAPEGHAPVDPTPAVVPQLPPPAAPAPSPPLTEEEGRRFDLIWSASMVGALVALFLVLSLFRGVAIPVVLALATAYVLNPAATWLARHGMSRTLATTLVFIALTLAGVAAVLYLVPVFREEAAKLPEFFRRASTHVLPFIEERFGVSLPALVRERFATLGGEASEVLTSLGPAAGKLLRSFANNTAQLLATVLGLLVVPVLTFFFVMDYPHIIEQAKALLPRRSVELISRRFAEVDAVLSSFVQGQITVGAILSVIYASGLAAARVDLAIVIGVIAGFGNMVPYLGTAIGLVLAAVGILLSWDGPWQLGVVVGTFVVAQLLEGLVITPRVVGEKVGLAPVVVIIAILAFGELFGFLGILLAVPASAILKVVLTVVIDRYRATRLYQRP